VWLDIYKTVTNQINSVIKDKAASHLFGWPDEVDIGGRQGQWKRQAQMFVRVAQSNFF
jgi:hypothetical protein